MVAFIFLVVQGLHKGEGAGTVWLLQPFISENAHLIPIITGATIVCFSSLVSMQQSHAGRDTRRRTRDPESHLPDGGLWWRYFYRGVVLYAAFFPDISRFVRDPDAALPEIALYVGGKAVPVDFPCTMPGTR